MPDVITIAASTVAPRGGRDGDADDGHRSSPPAGGLVPQGDSEHREGLDDRGAVKERHGPFRQPVLEIVLEDVLTAVQPKTETERREYVPCNLPIDVPLEPSGYW